MAVQCALYFADWIRQFGAYFLEAELSGTIHSLVHSFTSVGLFPSALC